MKIIWDSAVLERIEPFFIGWGIIKNVTILKDAKALDGLREEVYSNLICKFKIDDIKDIPVVRTYRKFSWQYLNIDPTKVRPSGEALARRVIKGQNIPIINSVVYAINLASIETQLSFSGFDLQRIIPPLIVRYAEVGEKFRGLGTRNRVLTGNELLLADREKILCIYAYGDGDTTKITLETNDILLITYGVPNIGAGILMRGVEIGLKYIKEVGGGEIYGIEVNKSVHQEL